MSSPIRGLHHVTAIAGHPQENVDFHVGVLGLRFIKLTVNFDDPGTYHTYFADDTGTPGSVLTFFPWPNAQPGRVGAGQSVATAYAVPPGAVDFWMGRFADLALDFDAPTTRFGQRVLGFQDVHGMPLELIEEAAVAGTRYWAEGPIPEAAALRRFHSVTLAVERPALTATILTDVFGYRLLGEENGRLRFVVPEGQGAVYLDLVHPETLGLMDYGRPGTGVTHHIAFRTPDDDTQRAVQQHLRQLGMQVTEVRDRQYFHSIYFREPNGVLFEVATDVPGFMTDEPYETLGQALKLPPQYEGRRAEIEKRLIPLRIPAVQPDRLS